MESTEFFWIGYSDKYCVIKTIFLNNWWPELKKFLSNFNTITLFYVTNESFTFKFNCSDTNVDKNNDTIFTFNTNCMASRKNLTNGTTNWCKDSSISRFNGETFTHATWSKVFIINTWEVNQMTSCRVYKRYDVSFNFIFRSCYAKAMFQFFNNFSVTCFSQSDLTSNNEGTDEHCCCWETKHAKLKDRLLMCCNCWCWGTCCHTGSYGNCRNKPVWHRTTKFINKWTNWQSKWFITVSQFPLTIFYWVRDNHEDNKEHKRLWNKEEFSSSQDHWKWCSCNTKDSDTTEHYCNTSIEQTFTVEFTS